MIIDVTIASGLAIIIVMLLLITFGNIPRSDIVNVGNYKHAESILYSFKHDGTLQQAVEYIDGGNEGEARGLIVSEFARLNLPFHPTIVLETYDNSMNEVHTVVIQKGPAVKEKYIVTLPFRPNSTLSKFAIAKIEVGR